MVKTYWSKKHFDDYFARKAPDPEIKEWYSTQDMQEKFGMTLTAIYSFVSKNAIPKKKVGIMVYYSKKHVDIAKGLIAPEEPKYLHHCRSDGAIQSDTGPTLPLCEIP